MRTTSPCFLLLKGCNTFRSLKIVSTDPFLWILLVSYFLFDTGHFGIRHLLLLGRIIPPSFTLCLPLSLPHTHTHVGSAREWARWRMTCWQQKTQLSGSVTAVWQTRLFPLSKWLSNPRLTHTLFAILFPLHITVLVLYYDTVHFCFPTVQIFVMFWPYECSLLRVHSAMPI